MNDDDIEWEDTFERMQEEELRQRLAERHGWEEEEVFLYRKIGTEIIRLARYQRTFGETVYAMFSLKEGHKKSKPEH
jgi:hypothetical protein